MTGSPAQPEFHCETLELRFQPTSSLGRTPLLPTTSASDAQSSSRSLTLPPAPSASDELLWQLNDWRRTQVFATSRTPLPSPPPAPSRSAATDANSRSTAATTTKSTTAATTTTKDAVTLTLTVVPQSAATTVEYVQSWQATWESLPPIEGGPVQSILLTLQGAQILWRPERVFVVAPPERLATVCRAIVEATWHEAELRSLEQATDSYWNEVEEHAPLAFEFDSRSLARRGELAERFRNVQSLRARFARLAPHILVPHVHPPTLASQIGERLRERMRMADRLELLDGKLDAQERIYEMCSQRVSEFMISRRGHRLEWAIIALLLIQTVIVLYEFFFSSAT